MNEVMTGPSSNLGQSFLFPLGHPGCLNETMEGSGRSRGLVTAAVTVTVRNAQEKLQSRVVGERGERGPEKAERKSWQRWQLS